MLEALGVVSPYILAAAVYYAFIAYPIILYRRYRNGQS